MSNILNMLPSWRLDSTEDSGSCGWCHLGLVPPVGCWQSAVYTLISYVSTFFPLFPFEYILLVEYYMVVFLYMFQLIN